MLDEHKVPVYIVTSGSYSDYRIVAAFLDEEEASLVTALNKGYRLETYDTGIGDIARANVIHSGRKPFVIIMYRDGEVHYSYQAELDAPLETDYHLYQQHFSPYPQPSKLEVNCWAEDEQHAIKIANERRIMLIATDSWPPDQDDKGGDS